MRARIFTTGQTAVIMPADDATLSVSFKIDVMHMMPMEEHQDTGSIHVPKRCLKRLRALAADHQIEILPST